MDNQIDKAHFVSAMIMRGNPGWMIGLAGRFDGDTEEHDVAAPELYGMPTDKSLVETEIMLTAWLAGRGFHPSTPWSTYSYSGSGHRAADVRAEFERK